MSDGYMINNINPYLQQKLPECPNVGACLSQIYPLFFTGRGKI